jgi:hypothetical protein
MSNVINLDVAKRVDIICRKGDTFKLEIDLKDSTGAAVPSNAYTFKMEVRTADYANTAYSPNGDTDQTIILSTEDLVSPLSKTIIPIASTGKVVFNVVSSIMRTVPAGMYVYDIEAISTLGESQTWLYGTFKVNEDISV